MAIHIVSLQRFYSRHRVFLIAGGGAIVPVRWALPRLRARAADAWHVLTGRYDAVSWDYIGTEYRRQGDAVQ